MDNLEKKIPDIKLGKLISEDSQHGNTHDYTHILPDKFKAEDYTLHVNHNPQAFHPLTSTLRHKDKVIGKVVALTPDKNTLEPHVIKGFGAKSPHRGKGLARNMYEALYAHGNNLGFNTVKGGYHTLAASKVHQSLSNKHGLEYKPELIPSKDILDEFQVMPYEYKLKTALKNANFNLGIKKTEDNLYELQIQDLLKKEVQFDPTFVGFKVVGNVYPDGVNAAINVQEAFKQGLVFPINMGGKHSAGSLIAKDMITNESYLLKPGSGKLSPVAGVREENISEATREVAFWHVAESWNLGSYVPRADMLLIDGKEYACIQMLPWEYKTLGEIKQYNYDLILQLLKEYAVEGMTYKWAALFWVLGEGDGHGNNVMLYGKDIKLIDHGSSFAGWGFNPAFDPKSFIPYCLRFMCKNGFMKLDPEDRYKYMIALDDRVDHSVKQWIMDLDISSFIECLQKYDINTEPFVYRLSQLKILCNLHRIDHVIGKLWCGLC